MRVYLEDAVRFFFKVLMTVVLLIPSTRAVSRIPLLLIAISTTCSLIPGLVGFVTVGQHEAFGRASRIVTTVAAFTTGTVSSLHYLMAAAMGATDFLVTCHQEIIPQLSGLTRYQHPLQKLPRKRAFDFGNLFWRTDCNNIAATTATFRA